MGSQTGTRHLFVSVAVVKPTPVPTLPPTPSPPPTIPPAWAGEHHQDPAAEGKRCLGRACLSMCCCRRQPAAERNGPAHLCVLQCRFLSLEFLLPFSCSGSASFLSLQRRQSRPGVRHRWLLEHRRGQLHQSRALCVWDHRSLRRGWTLWNAGLRLRSDIRAQLRFYLHN